MAALRLLTVAAILVAGLAAPAGAGSAPTRMRFDRGAEDCTQVTPAAIEPPASDRRPVRIDVTVLLDGVPLRDAEATMRGAASSYTPLGMRLVTTYRPISLAADGDRATSGGTKPAMDVRGAIADAKTALQGARPSGSDVVYVMTAKDLFTFTDDDGDGMPDEDERSYGIAGYADCIGGVRYADRAFAIGEVATRVPVAIAGLEMFGSFSEKVAAHEIGHLFGAQHHLSNCSEGVAAEARGGTPVDVGPCTLMFNDVGLATLHFSSLNAAVVRGHVRYLQ